MDFKEEYKNIITTLSESLFKDFVKQYVMSYWNTDEVEITDGPWDGGVDIVYYKNEIAQKKNIQITVQDKFEVKLMKDVEKSKRNVDKYGYQSSLYFFISKPISHSKKDELIDNAERNYDISLKIFDANKLASDIERFPKLCSYLTSVFSPKLLHKPSFDIRNKVIYDMFTTGSNIANIKYDFINSFIQYYLLGETDKTIDEILAQVNSQLADNLSHKAIQGQLDYQVKKGILVCSNDKKYSLSNTKKEEFQKLRETSETLLQSLMLTLQQCLEKYNLQFYTNNVCNKLIELYNAHYNSEIEVINQSRENKNISEHKVFEDLENYLKRLSGSVDANALVKDILFKVSDNVYLNKIAITTMFTNLFRSNSLDAYFSMFKKKIYLDTQVLLQVICWSFKNVDYDDIQYGAVNFFMQQVKSQKDKVCLLTTKEYVEEAVYHLWEAYRLQRLLDIPTIKDLGPSKNVFFNFYLFLSQNDYYEDFTDFLYDLLGEGISVEGLEQEEFIAEVSTHIESILKFCDIDVVFTPYYDELKLAQKEYDMHLIDKKYSKPKRAQNNDLICMLYLSDQNYHINPDSGLLDEPFFITWDSTIYTFRKKFLHKLKGRSYFYIYTPMKFANRLSVMNLKINASCINYDIISLAENNFKYSNDSISFIDTLSAFFKRGDASNWKLGQQLASMRKQQQDDSELSDFVSGKQKNQPIDVVLKNIKDHYNNNIQTSFDRIVKVFEMNEIADDVIKIISKGCEIITTKAKLDDDYFKMFDKFINDESPLVSEVVSFSYKK